jgi:acyl carrier protein/NADP-dependent 3-hydroxy acid dehydrogenase YdfG
VEALLLQEPTLAGSVTLANDNAPFQVVLSGSIEGIERAEALMKASRLTTFRLPVASAFHSHIVAASCEPFAEYLKSIKFSKSKGVVYSNATANPYGRNVSAQLADQLQRPVRFREMIETMAGDGVTRFIEVGSGRVLTALVDQILAESPHLAVALDDRKAGALRGWNRGLAALAADGVPLDLAALLDSYERPESQPPKPAHAVLVGGANLGKPYPPREGSASKARHAPRVAPSNSPAAIPMPAAFVPPIIEATPHNAFASAPAEAQAPAIGIGAPAEAWSVIDRIQSETVEQHRHYLDVMARSHEAFLQMSAQMMDHLIGGGPSAPLAPYVQAPVVSFAPVAPMVTPAAAPHLTVESPPSAPPPGAPLEDVVLAIVVEKTGYPLDMLNLDMEMEAELGIDSIKQVEILAGVQELFPEAPDIPASELSALKTLRDVVNAISALAGAAGAAEAPLSLQAISAPARPMASPDDLRDSVLSIVAEKTGYPRDMLNLDMEMEAELGIDSIKQVEILSALQDRWPEAPEVSASDLAGLKTLRDVSNALANLGSGGGASRAGVPEETKDTNAASSTPTTMEAVLLERPRSGFAMAGLFGGVVVHVTNENPSFANEVVALLEKLGISASVVSAVPVGASAAISLAAVTQARSAAQSLESHLKAFHAAQAVAQSEGATRLFVTVQSSGGRFGIGGGEGKTEEAVMPCGVAGLVKTAAREWENASVKAIDMQSLDAARLVEELLSGGPELEVALLADGRRLVVSERIIQAARSAEVSLSSEGVVLVSGGARGVTARCALALGQRKGVRLALLGRSARDAVVDTFPELTTQAEIASAVVEASRRVGKPVALAEARRRALSVLAQREISATLDLARQSGVEARYYSVDVADAERVAAIVGEVRRDFGPIVGIIHGAGVLADKRLADLDDAQFAMVFLPKVAGAEALLAATRDDDLRMVTLFSSVAARKGNSGQGAYAAANEVLNAIAARERSRRGSTCAVRAFGWGPWDGGMVDAALRKHFERAGVGLIDVETGAAYFGDEACRVDASPVIVVAASNVAPLRHAHMNWTVSTRGLAPLSDHVVQGRIVLPVVVVLERILRAAHALASSENVCASIRDLQVLSGVTLPVDAEEEVVLSIAFEPKGPSYVVTLRDSAQRSRYRAVVEWREGRSVRAALAVHAPATPWDVTVKQAYAGPLFHGARFEALVRLEGVDGGGGVAVVRRSTDLGWPDEPWATDPAALDGGLQLGLLWANANRRGVVLPQRIAGFVQHIDPPPGAPLRCRFAARPISDKRIDFDFVLETMTGDLVAEISGAEFYALGAGASAAP